MPPPQTGIGMLAEAIDKVQKNPFEGRIEGAAGYMQDYLAPEMPFMNKLAMANRWLFKPLLIKSISATNGGNATMRTTIAPTIFEAGVKDNVLPIEAMAKINFRILPGDTMGTVINHVKKVINNDKVVIERMGTPRGQVRRALVIRQTAANRTAGRQRQSLAERRDRCVHLGPAGA